MTCVSFLQLPKIACIFYKTNFCSLPKRHLKSSCLNTTMPKLTCGVLEPSFISVWPERLLFRWVASISCFWISSSSIDDIYFRVSGFKKNSNRASLIQVCLPSTLTMWCLTRFNAGSGTRRWLSSPLGCISVRCVLWLQTLREGHLFRKTVMDQLSSNISRHIFNKEKRWQRRTLHICNYAHCVICDYNSDGCKNNKED